MTLVCIRHLIGHLVRLDVLQDFVCFSASKVQKKVRKSKLRYLLLEQYGLNIRGCAFPPILDTLKIPSFPLALD